MIIVPKKEFHIVGIPEGDNWVRKEAKRRSNVKVYPILPYEEWFELCKDFDVSLYQLPKKAYSSIDANMGLPMLMQKPTVYYGPLAPKERMIHGENAHSRYFSEDAFKKLKGDNKELLIIKDANHVDLYDNFEKIPFDKIEQFFKTNL